MEGLCLCGVERNCESLRDFNWSDLIDLIFKTIKHLFLHQNRRCVVLSVSNISVCTTVFYFVKKLDVFFLNKCYKKTFLTEFFFTSESLYCEARVVVCINELIKNRTERNCIQNDFVVLLISWCAKFVRKNSI